jgi:hypothetical protein
MSMFEVIDENDNSYRGYIASPGRQWQARSFPEVLKILMMLGVIEIYGHDEMILPMMKVKNCFVYSGSI